MAVKEVNEYRLVTDISPTIQKVEYFNRVDAPFRKKINPIWWLMNGDSWEAPLENNGTPYLPEVKNQFLRNFYWWCRNPCANFVGYVIGVEGKDFSAIGSKPIESVTPRDEFPPRVGFKWAILQYKWLRLPFIAYNGWIEFYLGWRPTSGGFGFKLVKGSLWDPPSSVST